METLKNGKHWNAITVEERLLIDGRLERKTEFHSKWVNYLDANDEWQPIDCNLVQTPSGFKVTEAPFLFTAPLLATGVAVFESNVRFDVFNKRKITDAPVTQTLKALEAVAVQGEIFDMDGNGRTDAVIYRQAFPQWDADLIYFVHHGRAPRLKKLVRFNSPISADIQINFEVGFDGTPVFHKVTLDSEKRSTKTKWNEKAKVRSQDGFSIQSKDAVSSQRGVGMKEFFIWDSAVRNIVTGSKQAIQKINVDIEKLSAGQYKLTKNIPVSFFTADKVFPIFTDTVTTFYPDPDAETTTVDGYSSVDDNTGASWASIHDDNGTNARASANSNGTDLHVRCDRASSGNSFSIARAIILFDTASLPDSDQIDSAILSIKGTAGKNGTGNFCIIDSNPASNTNVVATDYDNFTVHQATPYSGLISVASWSESAYNDFTLVSAGLSAISKTGITKMGCRLEVDYAETTGHGSAPGTTITYMFGASADTSGTTSDPKLVVTHSAGATHVTVSATVQTATFTIPAYTVTAIRNVTESPSALSIVASLPASSVITSVSIAPSAQVATFSIPVFDVPQPDAYIYPTAVVGTFSIPAYTVRTDTSFALSTQGLALSIPSPTVITSYSATPSAQVLTFSIPTYGSSVDVTLEPSAKVLTFSIPSYSVLITAIAEVSVLSMVFTIPEPPIRGRIWGDKFSASADTWNDKHSASADTWNNKY